MSNLARDHRNRDITLIQIARRQLHLTDADYYALIKSKGGADSSTALDAAGRANVLAYMATLGFKPTRAKSSKRPKRPTPPEDRAHLVRRIRAQLISLDRKPDAYADGIAKQMLGSAAPEYFEWCEPRDLYKISQALGVEQKRTGAPTK